MAGTKRKEVSRSMMPIKEPVRPQTMSHHATTAEAEEMPTKDAKQKVFGCMHAEQSKDLSQGGGKGAIGIRGPRARQRGEVSSRREEERKETEDNEDDEDVRCDECLDAGTGEDDMDKDEGREEEG